MLAGGRYLLGDTLTEADVRLFMTLIRFDHVSLFGLCGPRELFSCWLPAAFGSCLHPNPFALLSVLPASGAGWQHVLIPAGCC